MVYTSQSQSAQTNGPPPWPLSPSALRTGVTVTAEERMRVLVCTVSCPPLSVCKMFFCCNCCGNRGRIDTGGGLPCRDRARERGLVFHIPHWPQAIRSGTCPSVVLYSSIAKRTNMLPLHRTALWPYGLIELQAGAYVSQDFVYCSCTSCYGSVLVRTDPVFGASLYSVVVKFTVRGIDKFTSEGLHSSRPLYISILPPI